MKGSFIIGDEFGKHIPFGPGSIESGIHFLGVPSIISEENTQVLKVGEKPPVSQFIFPNLSFKRSRSFSKDRDSNLLLTGVLCNPDGLNVFSEVVVGGINKLFNALLVQAMHNDYVKKIVSIYGFGHIGGGKGQRTDCLEIGLRT